MSTLQIASFPATHPYVEAVRPTDVVAVSPPRPDETNPWAPHPWWEPSQLRRHATDIDVVHVHFGYDHMPAAVLRDWTEELQRCRVPLVVTVHDLRNPHHDTSHQHLEQLGVLLAAAAQVITLTPGAAAVVAGRWQRTATVLPHPTLLDPACRPPRRPAMTVGLHLKSLRRNVVEPAAVVAAVARGASDAGACLLVDLHPDVVDRPAVADIRKQAGEGRLELRVHRRYDDADLQRYLQTLDVSVLPHRFGTHSGWLELCRDLGTRVVAPDCGFYAEQWPAVQLYGNNEGLGLDAAALTGAVAAAVRAGPLAPADPAHRVAERKAVRQAHLELYRRIARAGR